MGEVRSRIASWGPGAGHLLGARPQPDVAAWMAACDVMTLPSWAEGTPNVVLEALAAGRPVVASRVGGIPDAIIEGVTGILVAPHDCDDLADGLRAALRRRWDEAAIVASAPPSWEESAGRLFDLLWEAAHGDSRERGEVGGTHPL